MARISAREFIKNASSPVIFSKVARFCNVNLPSKRLKFHSENRCHASLTSKCRSVNKHLERMFS